MKSLTVEIFGENLIIKDDEAICLLEEKKIKVSYPGYVSKQNAFDALRFLANFFMIELKIA